MLVRWCIELFEVLSKKGCLFIDLAAFASIAHLGSRGVEERQKQEILSIEKTVQKLQHQTAHPALPDDVNEEESEIFSQISMVCFCSTLQ